MHIYLKKLCKSLNIINFKHERMHDESRPILNFIKPHIIKILLE